MGGNGDMVLVRHKQVKRVSQWKTTTTHNKGTGHRANKNDIIQLLLNAGMLSHET